MKNREILYVGLVLIFMVSCHFNRETKYEIEALKKIESKNLDRYKGTSFFLRTNKKDKKIVFANIETTDNDSGPYIFEVYYDSIIKTNVELVTFPNDSIGSKLSSLVLDFLRFDCTGINFKGEEVYIYFHGSDKPKYLRKNGINGNEYFKGNWTSTKFDKWYVNESI